MPMLIGLKYCGSCHPSYDRRALLRQVQALLPEAQWEPARPGTVYDRVLVINACPAQCADTQALTAARDFVSSYGKTADLLAEQLSGIEKN